MSAFISRSLTRTAASCKPRVACIASTRGIVSGPPPPPPPSPGTEPRRESMQFNIPLLVGAVAACGAGYYYLVQQKATEEQAVKDSKDFQKKARELEEAARAQSKEKIEQLKASGKATYDDAQSRVQSTYNDATNKANAIVSDVQDRATAYKDSAVSTYGQAVNSTTQGVHDAKVYVEDKAEEAKSSWWSWFGWGKKKGDDAQREVAQKTAEAARAVKDSAADVEKRAQSRTQ